MCFLLSIFLIVTTNATNSAIATTVTIASSESNMYIINKYVYYKDHPMTEEMLIEHNWSFKEIGEFLLTWCQISD